MNISFTTIVFLALASNGEAFQPGKPGNGHPSLDMSTAADIASRNEIDITSVLADVESALQAAKESVPTSKSIQNELESFSEIQQEQKATTDDDQLTATTMAGAAVGVVAGSPRVLGAALGIAGTQLLEGEQGKKYKNSLEVLGKKITEQLTSAVEYAKTEISKEEDPSKIPEKMIHLVRARASEDSQTFAHDVEEAIRVAPSSIMDAVKRAMESEEVHRAPGRAFNAIKTFLESDEVKEASGRALQVVKTGIEKGIEKSLEKKRP